MSMSSKKCCVPGCFDSGGSHKTLHLFPNPNKERERFNTWVMSIGGDIIGLNNDDIYTHRRVCHAHFEQKYCCRFNRLSNIAVPTLLIPSTISVPKFTFGERRPMSQIQGSCSSNTTSSSGVQANLKKESGYNFDFKENIDPEVTVPSIDATSSQGNLLSKNAVVAVPSVKNSEDESSLPGNPPDPVITFATPIEQLEQSASSSRANPPSKKLWVSKHSAAKRLNKRVILTRGEQNLHQKLVQARVKLSKYRSKIKKQSASIKAAKNLTNNPAFLATLENLPSTAKILTLLQFRECKKSEKGRRFTLKEKILALSIFKQAPKGYRFLRKLFILPAPQTLSKLVSQANLHPGISKSVFAQLKKVTENMKVEEKLCVLLFDEMSLKPSVTYNERKDKVTGFVTDGEKTLLDFADHAQVFMIRGLINNYKQPVSYTFSAAATKGPELAKQIKAVVRELQEAGFIIAATVCDQGTNNRQAIKLLIQETRGEFLRTGQEPKDNMFRINDQEIIPLYDPPHLLKCIRNNFLNKNLQYINNENKPCIAKWEHVILLHQENPAYNGVRLIPKLTENHVLPEKISKMKVKYASQVFSRCVAIHMGYFAGKGIIPKICSETADILLFFDSLFDSLNGSYAKKEQSHGKPLLAPVTPNSAHHEVWRKGLKRLKNMKFVNPATGKIENVPTLGNWVWTLEGVEILLKKLAEKYGVTSVWMRHLNQDPIENFFGSIRSHGCRDTNPTAEKFESSFTSLLINNISNVHFPGRNCERDHCEMLHTLIVSEDCTAQPTCDFDSIPDIEFSQIGDNSDPRIIGILHYISGYFIKKAQKNIFKNCNACIKDFIAQEASEYISYREYAGRRWLCSPSFHVVECISNIQTITKTILKKYLQKNNLKELIKTLVLIHVNFNFIRCEEHKDNCISYIINIVIKFFIYNYCKTLNRILLGRKDVEDSEDGLQIKAKKRYRKCFKRKIN